MKITVLSLILVTGLRFACNSQTNYVEYYVLVDSAQYLKSLGLHTQATKVFESAFRNFEGLGPDYLSLADCLLQVNEYDQAKDNLVKAITRGVPRRYLNRIRSEHPIEAEKQLWLEIDSVYTHLRNDFYLSIDLEIYLRLQLLKQSDQQIREYLMSEPTYSSDTLLREYAGKIDSINLITLLSIIEDNGGLWPGLKSFGDGESGAYYILLHLSSTYFKNSTEYQRIYDYLYEVAKKGVQSGELTPFQFAYWVDYQSKSEEGVQVYGVPSYMKWQKIPFKNIGEIDLQREEIGLPPLRTLYERKGEELPTWYQYKEK